MSPFTIILYVMIFIISVLLVALILIQPSKSGGMGAAFGGVGESAFGGKAGSHLTKTTVVMTTIFFIVALVLAAFIGHGLGKGNSGWQDELKNGKDKAANVVKGAVEGAVEGVKDAKAGK